MGLLRHIPTQAVDDAHPFLKKVDFTRLEARLAAEALTHNAAAPTPRNEGEGEDYSDPRVRLTRIVQTNVRLKDLRMILAASGANSAWVTGPKGIGKTTLVEALLRARAQRQLTSQLQAKPFFIFDVNDFFVENNDSRLVECFRSALDLVVRQHGLVVIDHIDDFVQMAKSDAGRLINALVSRLDKDGGFQAIVVSEDDKRDMVADASTGVERRFVELALSKEPSLDDLRPVLLAHFVRLEDIHNVNFTDEAADEIIRLLARFPGHAFTGVRPANAIAFADSVAAAVRMNMYAEPPELAALREKIGALSDRRAILHSDGGLSAEAFAQSEEALEETQAAFDLQKAAWDARVAPLFKAQNNLNVLMQRQVELDRKGADRTKAENDAYDVVTKGVDAARLRVVEEEKALYPEPPRVTAAQVQAVFNDRAGVSFESMNENVIERLSRVDAYLDSEIFLQSAAKSGLARAYRAREMGVASPSGPAGVIMFTGGTGLGKTELTEVLARFDGGENAKPITVRLSEYKGKSAVSRLTGADPGLVGFDMGSPTLEAVEANPRAILLLDEIDKADPAVNDVLMQILEKGEIRLATGKLLDFKNTIIVIGSNALTDDDLTPEEMANQSLHQDGIRKKLAMVRSKDTGEHLFRPEFIRRIREIYVFERLGKSQFVDILMKEVRKVNRDYARNGISIDVDRDTAAALVEHFDVSSMGGSGPKWIVDSTIRTRLTDYLMTRLQETGGDKSKIRDRLCIGFADGAVTMVRQDEPKTPTAIPAAPMAQAATPR